MERTSPQDGYLDPYRQAVKQHGAGFEATLWGSEEAQRLRFDVMIEMVGFENCTMVDAGCGRGDLADHLLKRGVPFRRYIGIDAMTPMIERARQRGLERSEFIAADFVHDPSVMAGHQADFICFSGSLNTMDDPTAQRVVSAAFEQAAQGVIFNFLSDRHQARWAGRDLSPARRFDTVKWLDWSLQQTSRVAFDQSYLDGHDATILLVHD